MWFALSGSFYGRKLPDKIFVYVRTFGEYKTEIYVGKSFSLLDTEQRNEITFPSDTIKYHFFRSFCF